MSKRTWPTYEERLRAETAGIEPARVAAWRGKRPEGPIALGEFLRRWRTRAKDLSAGEDESQRCAACDRDDVAAVRRRVRRAGHDPDDPRILWHERGWHPTYVAHAVISLPDGTCLVYEMEYGGGGYWTRLPSL